jgi:RNA polymerase sigma-70 factor (ECF subfamily)
MSGLLTSLFSVSDEQMMWRVKTDGDGAAFARLVARWERPVQRLCARMTGDPHRAEDLTQTVFARVFARRASWEPRARFSTYLWRVALNLCRDDLRRMSRRDECSLDALAEESSDGLDIVAAEDPPPDVQAQAQERGEMVRQALGKLPAHYREVLVLRHYQQLKFHEIGEVLDIPTGTAKSRTAEALRQLGLLLQHLNDEESCNRKTKTAELLVQ